MKSDIFFLSGVHGERRDTLGVCEYLVSWEGYPRGEDSWIKTLPSHFEEQWTTQKDYGIKDSSLHVLAEVACQELHRIQTTW